MISGPESDTVTPGSTSPRESLSTPSRLPFAPAWGKAGELAARTTHPRKMKFLVEQCGITYASSI
jgi:hypothetical protein